MDTTRPRSKKPEEKRIFALHTHRNSVSAYKLARLYCIPHGYWIEWNRDRPVTYLGRRVKDYIHLGMRADNAYFNAMAAHDIGGE